MSEQEDGGKGFEILCGVTLALLAAVLAITDLGAGKYGDDELIAHNEKASAYLWYQAKSIKETLVEGQRDTLQALVAAGAVRPEQLPAVAGLIGKLDQGVARYGKEKKEILLGSAQVGRAGWAQAVDGELGRVVGAQEWEKQAAALGAAGDTFDLATFFLQVCLVLGAISLVVQFPRMRNTLYGLMVALGLAGTVCAVLAFVQAAAIG
jgi:Domain of unknown function (DUF4337)